MRGSRSSSSALEHELVVERRLERDRHARVARDRPAVAPDALDEHLVRLEHVPVDPEAAAVELLELAARERARTAPSSVPSFGPSTGRFGFTRSSVASTSPNSTSFTRSSSAISSACDGRERCALGRRAGAAAGGSLSRASSRAGARARRRAARRRPRRAARRRAAPGSGQRREDAPTRSGSTRCRQRWSARNGMTGATTRSACVSDVVERAERRRCRRPRSAAASGGCTSSRGPRRTTRTRDHDARRPVALVLGGRIAHELRGPRLEPAVERSAARQRRRRVELRDRRVRDEERDGVPEREQAALHLVGEPVAEAQRLARRLRAVEPARDVRAHPVERVVQLDRVAASTCASACRSRRTPSRT